MFFHTQCIPKEQAVTAACPPSKTFHEPSWSSDAPIDAFLNIWKKNTEKVPQEIGRARRRLFHYFMTFRSFTQYFVWQTEGAIAWHVSSNEMDENILWKQTSEMQQSAYRKAHLVLKHAQNTSCHWCFTENTVVLPADVYTGRWCQFPCRPCNPLSYATVSCVGAAGTSHLLGRCTRFNFQYSLRLLSRLVTLQPSLSLFRPPAILLMIPTQSLRVTNENNVALDTRCVNFVRNVERSWLLFFFRLLSQPERCEKR